MAAFRKGLNEAGYVDGQNVTVEYHWLEGQYDLPALMADVVRRRVAVIVTPGNLAAIGGKSGNSDNPDRLRCRRRSGPAWSCRQPRPARRQRHWHQFFHQRGGAKRLRLLHDLAPKAVRFAVLVNPANASSAEAAVRDVRKAAPTLGLQIQVLNASTIGEIDAAFATLESDRADALFVAPDAFFASRAVQFVTLTARDKIPAAYSPRAYVTAGGLMSYGADFADSFHQAGDYTGKILKGAKPADLPVLQSTKFEFVINLQTARALGIEVPPALLSIADEVIE